MRQRATSGYPRSIRVPVLHCDACHDGQPYPPLLTHSLDRSTNRLHTIAAEPVRLPRARHVGVHERIPVHEGVRPSRGARCVALRAQTQALEHGRAHSALAPVVLERGVRDVGLALAELGQRREAPREIRGAELLLRPIWVRRPREQGLTRELAAFVECGGEDGWRRGQAGEVHSGDRPHRVTNGSDGFPFLDRVRKEHLELPDGLVEEAVDVVLVC